MVKYTDFDPNIQEILEEMCNRVGMTIQDVDFDDDKWFSRKQWTELEQEDFKEWLVSYLKNNKTAKMSVINNARPSKKKLQEVADWFITQFGWTQKQEDE